jgi:hypothetical protein
MFTKIFNLLLDGIQCIDFLFPFRQKRWLFANPVFPKREATSCLLRDLSFDSLNHARTCAKAMAKLSICKVV